MQINKIAVNSNLMETTQHKSLDLPMQVYTDIFDEYVLKYINWHWHNEFEFGVVLNGSIKFLVEDSEIVLTEGEGIFINSSILHQIEPISAPNETTKFCILFSPHFIASSDQGNIFDKYVTPVILNQHIKHYIFKRDIAWQREILDSLYSIYQVDDEKAYGYELLYHSVLFHIWNLFIMNTSACSTVEVVSDRNRLVRERVNDMLDFMKENYNQDITVQDIANHANISKSECFRCFQACIGVNPYEFLQKYRIERAAVLLCTTQSSVSYIASACGFNNSSYFGMVFKRSYGKTPLKYRMQSQT